MALDTDEIAALSDDQKWRYMAMERLFDQEGWKLFQGWCSLNADEQLSRLVNCKTWEENRMAVGARAAFLLALNVENVTDAEFRNHAKDNKPAMARDDDDEAEDDVENQT